MKNNSNSGGVSAPVLLLITFVVLKLTNVIDWSWWWVLSPMWISFLFIAFIIGGAFLYYYLKNKFKKNN